MTHGPELARFDNRWFSPGRPGWVQALWFFIGMPLMSSRVLPSSAVRRWLLRLFGGRIGEGVVVKPGVRIKYPWLLSVGDHSWIGEDVWIDNLTDVTVGHDVCISQGAYLCTGNHDWSDPAFRLMVGPIRVNDGAWVGARATICPGVTLGANAVACAGAVVFKDIHGGEVHAGNPATRIHMRRFRNSLPAETAG